MDGDAEEHDAEAEEGVAGLIVEGEDEDNNGGRDEEGGEGGVAPDAVGAGGEGEAVAVAEDVDGGGGEGVEEPLGEDGEGEEGLEAADGEEQRVVMRPGGGARWRGCGSGGDVASERKKRPSRAAAKVTRAPEREEPTKVAAMLMAMPIETRAAPQRPAARRMASAAGRSAAAMAAAGRMYWMAALVSM